MYKGVSLNPTGRDPDLHPDLVQALRRVHERGHLSNSMQTQFNNWLVRGIVHHEGVDTAAIDKQYPATFEEANIIANNATDPEAEERLKKLSSQEADIRITNQQRIIRFYKSTLVKVLPSIPASLQHLLQVSGSFNEYAGYLRNKKILDRYDEREGKMASFIPAIAPFIPAHAVASLMDIIGGRIKEAGKSPEIAAEFSAPLEGIMRLPLPFHIQPDHTGESTLYRAVESLRVMNTTLNKFLCPKKSGLRFPFEGATAEQLLASKLCDYTEPFAKKIMPPSDKPSAQIICFERPELFFHHV